MEVTKESAPAIWMMLMLVVAMVWAGWLHTPNRSEKAARASLAVVASIGIALMALVLAVSK